MTANTAYLLYLVFAVGGAGLYLLMPRSGKQHTLSGAVIGLLGTVGLLAVLGTRVIAPEDGSACFYLFAIIAVLSAARVVSHPKPVYAAMYFVLVVVAVAALLVLMAAEFLAVALIIIYAGAILVTYLFVIMLAQQSGSPVYDRRSREPFAAILAGFVLMGAVAGQAGDLPERNTAGATLTQTMAQTQEAEPVEASNTYAIGAMVMTQHVVALEMAGILLLVSMVGAIALSRKKAPSEVFEAPRKPLGQVGREVEPF